MEYEIKGDQNLKVVADGENDEAIALIGKAMERFVDITEEYNIAKAKYEDARYKLEKMFSVSNQEFGLKSVKNPYIGITYVQAIEGKTEIKKTINENKLKEDLEELGLSIEDYYIYEKKITGKRKESIKVTNND